jgi:ribosomal protein S4
MAKTVASSAKANESSNWQLQWRPPNIASNIMKSQLINERKSHATENQRKARKTKSMAAYRKYRRNKRQLAASGRGNVGGIEAAMAKRYRKPAAESWPAISR